MQLQSQYNTIDAMKLFMAFLVIGIHVGATFEINYTSFENYIMGIAVPFFFICSGFFFQNRLHKSQEKESVFTRSIMGYAKLYFLWHLVYFPMDLYYFCHNNHSLYDNFTYALRSLIFVGELLYTWPLWYLHGLIVSIIIIYLLRKCKLSLVQVWFVSIIMMLLGYYIHIVTNSHSTNDNIIVALCEGSVDIWGNADRNGPFRGFALVTTGMIIRQYIHYIKYEYLIGSISILLSFVLYNNSLPLHLLLSGSGIFVITASVRIKDRPIFFTFRNYSTLIYFTHMYSVILVHKLCKNFIINIFQIYLIWIIIFVITWIIAFLLNDLSKRRAFSWIQHFIG